MPQGSRSGSLLFNISLEAFFVLKDVDIINFADDNAPYPSAKNTDELISSLGKASDTLFKWFKDNRVKDHPDKSRLIVSTNQKTKGNENSDCEKLLGVKINNN